MRGYSWIVCRSCHNAVELVIGAPGLVPAQEAAMRLHVKRSPACRDATLAQGWKPADPRRYFEIMDYVNGCSAASRAT